MEEALFLDGGGYLGGDPAGDGGFVGDEEAAGLLDGADDGVDVPGQEGAEVDEIACDAELVPGLGDGLPEHVHLGAPADDGQVLALLPDAGLAELFSIRAFGDLLCGVGVAVEDLWLHEDDGRSE